jgi:hypothetical protein
LPVGTFDITASESYDGSTLSQEGSIVETVSGSSLVIMFTWDVTSGVDPSSGLELNGVKVAEFSAGEFPELVHVTGSGLTDAQLSMLQAVYDGMGELFRAAAYLLDFGLDNTGRVLPPVG